MVKHANTQQFTTRKTHFLGFGGDWKPKKLGDIGLFSKGKGLPKKVIGEDGFIPAIPYTSIYTDFNEIFLYEMISTFTNSKDVHTIASPHLLIAGSSNMLENVGKTTAYISQKEIAIGGDIILFQTSENVCFISYLLNSKTHRKKIIDLSQGSTIRHVYVSTFNKYEILLPPTIDEQNAIVKVIMDVDRLIKSLDKLITKKRNIKTATMQQLLTGKNRLPGFSGEWITRTFDQCFAFLPTGSNSRSELSKNDDGEIGYIHYGDIHTKWYLFLDCTKEEIPSISLYKVDNLPLLKDGDLIIADASEDYEGVGYCVEIKNVGKLKIVAGLHTLLLRADKSVLADGYKAYITSIRSVKNQLLKIATGISVYGISKTNLKNIEIPLPPTIDEQIKIAGILGDMQANIECLEVKRNKVRAIKQGVMQELLTGRTRLV